MVVCGGGGLEYTPGIQVTCIVVVAWYYRLGTLEKLSGQDIITLGEKGRHLLYDMTKIVGVKRQVDVDGKTNVGKEWGL